MPSNTLKYFERKAPDYTKESSSLVWRLQRKRECNAVFDLAGDLCGQNVLDLGCGAGFYTREALKRGAQHVTAVDFSQAMVEQLSVDRLPNVEGVVADAETVHFDTPFPTVICAGLLEFSSNPQALLNNAKKALADNGQLVCLFPPENWAGRLYKAFHLRNGLHIRLYSDTTFQSLCREAGMKIDATKFVFPYALVCRLIRDDIH